MKLLRYIFAAILLSLAAAASAAVYTPAEVPNVQLADSTRLVSNPDGILSSTAVTQIDRRLRDIRSRTTAEVAVVIIDDMASGYDIDAFTNELFDKWGLGKRSRDNGVLIVVAKDSHKYAIRPGKGAEGVLTDAICSRIGRNILVPAFRQDDYDGGILQAVNSIGDILEDPASAADIVAPEGNGAADDDFDFAEFIIFYFGTSVAGTLILALIACGMYISARKLNNYNKYLKFRSLKTLCGWLSLLMLGLPLLVYFPVKILMNRWRNGDHPCPNCGTLMNKLDEDADNEHLTPAQDADERLNSVDYDVWLCPNCNKEVIYAFKNPASTLTECPVCHAHACTKIDERILVQPTTTHAGRGERVYKCLNCHNITRKPFNIPKAASTPIIIVPGGGGRSGGFGGGGFGGGGFGGGMHGGGGASGSW